MLNIKTLDLNAGERQNLIPVLHLLLLVLAQRMSVGEVDGEGG